MQKNYYAIVLMIFLFSACITPTQPPADNTDENFSHFETRFLDQYWKEYPSAAIFIGYGKYYENLVIPDSAAFAGHIRFSKQWIDSLNSLDFQKLNDNNKISFNIIKNQLESDAWYMSTFKSQEWDASVYNLSGECYYILNESETPLDQRLRTLSKHIENAAPYYQAAFKILRHPTKESLGMCIMQNQGGLSIFGKSLSDSINLSHLTDTEKITLNKNISKTTAAIKGYIDSLNRLLVNKNDSFRNFRIGKELYADKFKYDLVTNFTPEEIYAKAIAENKSIHANMFGLASGLWTKYYKDKKMPGDSTALIQAVIDAISLQHAKPENFFDSLRNQVYALKRFVITKDLFDFDTTYPIIVRLMPAYERGFTIASAEFTPPYQKKGDTYFNIDDVTAFPKEKAESTLREYNNYMSQLLSIHEAMPGHCLQGIYNSKKTADVVRAVFQNGAMIEGWAVYTETMMLENGWGDNPPEMQLIHDKLKLRELGNVVIDYEIQCLNKPKEAIVDFLVKDCFQTKAQAEEKYHRATVSQVQLCSYYAGSSAIRTLREAYKTKMGPKYTLKDFHENFLKFGSSPVKYISERMLQKNN